MLSDLKAGFSNLAETIFALHLGVLPQDGCWTSAKTIDMTEPLAPELQGILDTVCYEP